MKFKTSGKIRVEDLIQQYENIIPTVDKELKESQISDTFEIPAKPQGIDSFINTATNGDPVCPEDLTEIASHNLSQMFSYFSGWANYVSGEITRAKCIHMVIERNAKVVESALKVYYREEEEVPAAYVEDRVNTDGRYVEMDSSALKAKVFVNKAEARLEQLKRSLNLISREQTRRADELERTVKENSNKTHLRVGRRTRI